MITGNMKILGLTGGIASGKSTVSRHLLGLGAAIIDTDRIAYELAMPHRPLWEAYLEHFGTGVLLPDNTLDRKAIGQRVFRDAMERRWVDDTAHPMIRKTVENQLETCKESGTSVAVLDVPLLFEVGWDSLAESVWVVYVPPAIQLSR
ncbi:MAG: dephospho-CoA kinase, partial [Selenomonadaceae bacterium]|nr:dephospho-CoA kinase [Selenomonadaceae bacterium]